MRWYANVDGGNWGPYERSDIERMIAQRRLLGKDYLRAGAGAEWVEARNDPTFGRLFSDGVDVSTVLPNTPSNVSPTGIKVYHAKRGTQWRLALLAFAFVLVALIPLKQILGWLSGGPTPEGRAFLAAAAVLLFLPVGIKYAANALRGLPRLTVTPEGLKLEGGIRLKAENWNSVGPFVIKNIYSGRFRQVRMASAKIIGSGASRIGTRPRTFAIPDQFDAPIDVIATELNAARARATGAPTTAAAEIVPTETPVGVTQFRLPWLTFALLAVLIAVFALENAFPVTPGGKALTPSIATLIAFGASSYKLIVFNGEWYRLFTAPLLHANLPHLVGNGIALLLGGWLLERLVGRLWFFAFFTIGALGGSLLSLALNPVNLVSVGASGALMGLFAALFISSFRYPSGTASRTGLQLNSLRILVPSLLPFFQSSTVGRIDYGAHIGGTLSGAALAFLLLRYWPEGAPVPQLRKVAASISATGALLFVASGGLAFVTYPKVVQAVRHARPTAPVPTTDVLSDHGPKRVACDSKWGTMHVHDPGGYQVFLQNCMNGNP